MGWQHVCLSVIRVKVGAIPVQIGASFQVRPVLACIWVVTIMVRAVPVWVRAVPVQVRVVPVQVRAVPLQVRAVPLQLRAVSVFEVRPVLVLLYLIT